MEARRDSWNLSVGLAVLAGITSGVQFWMLWIANQFSNQPSTVHLNIGMALFFTLATLSICLPRHKLRRNFLIVALLALVSGWILHLESIWNQPSRYGPSEFHWGGMFMYISTLGAPAWTLSLAATAESVNSLRSLPRFLVETFQQTWVKVVCIVLWTGSHPADISCELSCLVSCG